MHSKKVRMVWAVFITAVFVLCCSGCSDASERKKETAYAAFLVQKITDISTAVNGLKNQMSGFSEEKMSDEAWISETTNYISQINNYLDQITQYENIPEKMSTLHQNVISVCETGKTLISQFETGIMNQNLGIITQVGNGLTNLTDQTDTIIKQIKEMVGSDQ